MGPSKVVPAAAAFLFFCCRWFGGVVKVQASKAEPSLWLPQIVGDGSPVRKTVFSDKMRMIILVGLEGSGHHFMNAVLHRMCHISKNAVCPDVCDIANVLFNELGRFKDPAQYQNGLEQLRSDMRALARTAEHSRRKGTLPSVATFQWCRGVGEMSFPNYGGEDKPLQYVDVRLLAEEAERAGIDLRVIYMSRPATDILVSTTEHRQFGSFAHEARVLVNAASVIGSSLRELDSEFITCFAYDNVTSPAQASRVAEFVMPHNESASLFSETLLKLVRDPEEDTEKDLEMVVENHTDGWDLVSHRLQQKIDDIHREQC